MAKAKEETLETQAPQEIKTKEEKPAKVVCWLKSKANHIIEVIDNDEHKFIQPFGKILVDKTSFKLVSDADASYLTFVKA